MHTHALSRQLIFLESILQKCQAGRYSSTLQRMHRKQLRIWWKIPLRTHILSNLNSTIRMYSRIRRLPPVGVRIYIGCIMGNIILITDYAKQLRRMLFSEGLANVFCQCVRGIKETLCCSKYSQCRLQFQTRRVLNGNFCRSIYVCSRSWGLTMLANLEIWKAV
jgi:hypothetical protein